MNGRSGEGLDFGSELAPSSPDLLGSGVHDDPLVVASLFESSDLAVEGLGRDLAIVLLQDVCNALVVVGLHVFVEVEGAIELWVRHGVVVSVVLVIIEVEEVGGVVNTAEGVVGQRAEASVNLHGAVGRSQSVAHISDVVRELHGVSEDEHPRLAEAGDLRVLRVVLRVVYVHDLLSGGDANTRH